MPREKKPHLKRRADGRCMVMEKGLYFYGQTEAEAFEARED